MVIAIKLRRTRVTVYDRLRKFGWLLRRASHAEPGDHVLDYEVDVRSNRNQSAPNLLSDYGRIQRG